MSAAPDSGWGGVVGQRSFGPLVVCDSAISLSERCPPVLVRARGFGGTTPHVVSQPCTSHGVRVGICQSTDKKQRASLAGDEVHPEGNSFRVISTTKSHQTDFDCFHLPIPAAEKRPSIFSSMAWWHQLREEVNRGVCQGLWDIGLLLPTRGVCL